MLAGMVLNLMLFSDKRKVTVLDTEKRKDASQIENIIAHRSDHLFSLLAVTQFLVKWVMKIWC